MFRKNYVKHLGDYKSSKLTRSFFALDNNLLAKGGTVLSLPSELHFNHAFEYSARAVVCGNVVKVTRYSVPQRNYSLEYVTRKQCFPRVIYKNKKRLSNMARTRRNFTELVNCNAHFLRSFITLTFADNLTDVALAYKYFHNFAHKMQRRTSDFKYIVTVEFQKRGAVHFHMLSNLPYIPNAVLASIWGHGFVKVNHIDNVSNVGSYCAKYMIKSEEADKLFGHRAFSASAGLNRPVTVTDNNTDVLDYIAENNTNNCVYAQSFDFDNGFCHGLLGFYVFKRSTFSLPPQMVLKVFTCVILEKYQSFYKKVRKNT